MKDDAATPHWRVSTRRAADAASVRSQGGHGVSRAGQSVLEYTILLIVVVTALGGMHTYVRRGLQGRMKNAATEEVVPVCGPGGCVGCPPPGCFAVPQYDPYYAIGTGGFRSTITANYKFSPGGDVTEVDPDATIGGTGGTRFILDANCRSSKGCPSQRTQAPP